MTLKRGMCAVLISTFFLGAAAWAQEGTDQLLNGVDAKLLKKLRAEAGQDTARLYEKLGFSYFQQENFDRAFLYFHAAVQTNPKLYWSWYYLGLLNLESGDAYFRKAIEVNSSFAPAHYWLARVYAKKGKKEDAIKELDVYFKVAKKDAQEAQRVTDAQKLYNELKPGTGSR